MTAPVDLGVHHRPRPSHGDHREVRPPHPPGVGFATPVTCACLQRAGAGKKHDHLHSLTPAGRSPVARRMSPASPATFNRNLDPLSAAGGLDGLTYTAKRRSRLGISRAIRWALWPFLVIPPRQLRLAGFPSGLVAEWNFN